MREQTAALQLTTLWTYVSFLPRVTGKLLSRTFLSHLLPPLLLQFTLWAVAGSLMLLSDQLHLPCSPMAWGCNRSSRESLQPEKGHLHSEYQSLLLCRDPGHSGNCWCLTSLGNLGVHICPEGRKNELNFALCPYFFGEHQILLFISPAYWITLQNNNPVLVCSFLPFVTHLARSFLFCSASHLF